MRTIFYQLLSFILIFLYCANIGFYFFPGKIKTTLVISIFGFLYYFLRYSGNDPYKLKKIMPLIFPLSFWMLIVIVLNQSDQLWFLQYVILQILYMFGAVFVVDIGKISGIKYALTLVSIYILIQNMIAFLGMQIPTITNLIGSLQHSIKDYYENLFEFRARGFGEHFFFTGGIWTALGMLSITYLKKINAIPLVVYIILFLTMIVTGLFVARTSMTGLFALLLFLMPISKNWGKLILYGIGGILLITIFLSIEKVLISLNVDTGYAFEAIDNFIGTGKLQTGSSNRTIEMWKTLPTDIKTWVIGDAQYTDEKFGGYYMHIDVGYLRVIFYGGIIGLVLYLLYSLKLCQMIYYRCGKDSEIKYFLLIYYLLVLVWMWKGHSDTNYFLYLILFAPMYKYAHKTKLNK